MNMEKITVSDLCDYIYNCIKENKKIFRNNYRGFFAVDELSVRSCNYSNAKEFDILPYVSSHNVGSQSPSDSLKINNFTEEECLEYQKALLAIKRYNENKLIGIIKDGKELEL